MTLTLARSPLPTATRACPRATDGVRVQGRTRTCGRGRARAGAHLVVLHVVAQARNTPPSKEAPHDGLDARGCLLRRRVVRMCLLVCARALARLHAAGQCLNLGLRGRGRREVGGQREGSGGASGVGGETGSGRVVGPAERGARCEQSSDPCAASERRRRAQPSPPRCSVN